jgi:hypothetical protein
VFATRWAGVLTHAAGFETMDSVGAILVTVAHVKTADLGGSGSRAPLALQGAVRIHFTGSVKRSGPTQVEVGVTAGGRAAFGVHVTVRVLAEAVSEAGAVRARLGGREAHFTGSAAAKMTGVIPGPQTEVLACRAAGGAQHPHRHADPRGSGDSCPEIAQNGHDASGLRRMGRAARRTASLANATAFRLRFDDRHAAPRRDHVRNS